jgi:diguanylate cyclase (GGDEF)-like protein/PAS domain S-box-containing protein
VRDALAGMYSLRFDAGHVGEIRDANAAVCEMLGYTPDELNGQHCRVLGLGPDYATAAPPDRIAGFDAWIEAFARGEPASFRRETPFYTKDGDRRWVEVSATRVLPERRPPFALIHVYDLTDRAAQHRRLEQMALRDALTGLANRALLFRRVADALTGHDGSPGLLYVDLDGFKSINDTFGHAMGDAVLVHVAARLTAAVRPGDTVARLGGDEFAILCASTDAAELDLIAQRIRARLAGPVLLDDVTEIAITASIGAAIADRTGRIADADALVRAADAAMYADKHRHRAPTEV